MRADAAEIAQLKARNAQLEHGLCGALDHCAVDCADSAFQILDALKLPETSQYEAFQTEISQLKTLLSRFQTAAKEIISQYPNGLPVLLEGLKMVLTESEESEVGSDRLRKKTS